MMQGERPQATAQCVLDAEYDVHDAAEHDGWLEVSLPVTPPFSACAEVRPATDPSTAASRHVSVSATHSVSCVVVNSGNACALSKR